MAIPFEVKEDDAVMDQRSYEAFLGFLTYNAVNCHTVLRSDVQNIIAKTIDRTMWFDITPCLFSPDAPNTQKHFRERLALCPPGEFRIYDNQGRYVANYYDARFITCATQRTTITSISLSRKGTTDLLLKLNHKDTLIFIPQSFSPEFLKAFEAGRGTSPSQRDMNWINGGYVPVPDTAPSLAEVSAAYMLKTCVEQNSSLVRKASSKFIEDLNLISSMSIDTVRMEMPPTCNYQLYGWTAYNASTGEIYGNGEITALSAPNARDVVVSEQLSDKAKKAMKKGTLTLSVRNIG